MKTAGSFKPGTDQRRYPKKYETEDERKAARREISKRYYERHKDDPHFKSRWKRVDPEKARAIRKRYIERNADKIRLRYKAYCLRKYGITIEEFNRLVEKQHGVCAICGLPPSGSPPNNTILHVDHNHETGQIRGLLCGKCNRGLGYFNDDKDVLASAIGYLNECQ